jgi:uncharacterized LabA/DUF88 family protein
MKRSPPSVHPGERGTNRRYCRPPAPDPAPHLNLTEQRISLHADTQPSDGLNPLTPVGRQTLCAIVHGVFSTEDPIDTVAFILDGYFTRRVVQDLVGSSPTPDQIEAFCRSVITDDERIRGVAYYDCPPFDETRPLPISGTPYRFKSDPAYWTAFRFQEALLKNNFFSYRLGTLSFDGWRLKGSSIRDLKARTRELTDRDFEPILVQKQVGMMIGLDIARLSTTRFVQRLILVTSNADLIPVIRLARSNGTKVTIITGRRKLVLKKLIKACDEHRAVPWPLRKQEAGS